MKVDLVPLYVKLWDYDDWQDAIDEPYEFRLLLVSMEYEIPNLGIVYLALTEKTEYHDERFESPPKHLGFRDAFNVFQGYGRAGFWVVASGKMTLSPNVDSDDVGYVVVPKDATMKKVLCPWSWIIECDSLVLFEPGRGRSTLGSE